MKPSFAFRKTAISILLLLALAACNATGLERLAPIAPTSTSESQNAQTVETLQIEQAIRQAIEKEKANALALVMYDTKIQNIKISQDGNWATAWLVPVDPKTGQVVPAEPGMAIVRKENGTWLAILPSDPLWSLVMKEVPDDLISQQDKQAWSKVAELSPSAAPSAPLHGYLLPWTGGETMALTQSVGHDRYTPSGSAHFAFDFAKPGYPSAMFEVHAAKGGTVKQAIWTNPNGNPNNGNYILLEDTTTTPTSYMLYLHFAEGSIPEPLRVIGAHVAQVQMIGIADNTGVSSGNHLHFMVHTYPVSYWGTSVDITFDDVTINGGRPRIPSDLSYCKSSDVCDTTQNTYVSRNFMNPDNTPPTGSIDSPMLGAIISSNAVHLAGKAQDSGSGIASAQFIAKYNEAWHNIGSPFSSSPFSMDWDMCAAGVADGPISIALKLEDTALNQNNKLPGLVHISKNYTCPVLPPNCVPTVNQVALFAEKDFQGNCITLGVGSYLTAGLTGGLGDNKASSVQTGANVQMTLFSDDNLQGRSETFSSNDSNLSDNRIGSQTTSSVLVQTRTTFPSTPAPVWPANNGAYPSDASLSLSWRDTGGAAQFKAHLMLNTNEILSTDWQNETVWKLTSLNTGTYTWQVKAKNAAGESAWSSARSLIIQAASPSTIPEVSPTFTDTMETSAASWAQSANWTRSTDQNHTPGGAFSWKYNDNGTVGYDNGSPNSGYLTSPPIRVPASGTYYMRFWYWYETEENPYWDQRWVQISVDGGAYTNLIQLQDDPTVYWLRSPAISLAAYAGHQIRVRFYFATLDSVLNQYKGWYIDDFSITATPPPNCQDADNTPQQATGMSYGAVVNGMICPGGDVDYYKFQGSAGDQIGAWTEAQFTGSPLDTYLFLFDSDGRSILAKNDDEVPYSLSDSAVSYHLARNGTYYLKVKAWDNPSAGGPNYTYNLHLVSDNQDPLAVFDFPQSGKKLSQGPIQLQISASDLQSGISHVQFFWHSSDWQNSDWIALSDDWNGADGWNAAFDPAKYTNTSNVAFYAMVFDRAGNSFGTGVWNLAYTFDTFLPIVINR